MSEPGGFPQAENPFSTRHIRPSALPHRFPPGQTAQGLVELLRALGWQGEIVGPHGSGKSSLLCAIIPALAGAGRHAFLIELHDGQRRLPVDLRRVEDLTQDTVVVVDGYEQLSSFSRWRLRRFCRRRRLGLLVTSHQPTGLPLLCRTSVAPALAGEIVRVLLAGRNELVDADELARRLDAHRGNLRELLFELYDVYERRRR